MVMQDPRNVREAVIPRLNSAFGIIGRQYNILEDLRPRLEACAQPSRKQLASHQAHEQGDARLLRDIIAVLADSIPQLDVTADLLTSALKHALDSGAARDALPFLGPGQSQDQIADHLLAHPRAVQASFDLQQFHVSIHVELSLLRLTIDHYLDRCNNILRRVGLPVRNLQVQPVDPMVEARAYLARAVALIHAAYRHNIDAIYGPSDR